MMKSLLYKLKSLYYAGAAMKDMKKYALEMQLGHSKIIGWDGGHPVNSLLFPPEYSQPMIRSRARFYNSLRFGNPSPVVANIAVTARCRCSCPHCSSAGQDATDMPAKKWRDIIRQCQELGVFTIVITGGEPLERPDLEQIISAVDQSISLPVLFTCGMGLADRLEGLLASGLKRIYVSLDYADSTGHNGHRGVDGLFEQAVNGLKAARAMGM
ncbi:MAG: radical SAM protein, partial [Planctomycetes bacterium]|nr:radical SAM protein [Planctomycetota bacterium]